MVFVRVGLLRHLSGRYVRPCYLRSRIVAATDRFLDALLLAVRDFLALDLEFNGPRIRFR